MLWIDCLPLVSQEKIDTYFSRPAVIPAPAFHMTLDDALAAQDAMGYQASQSGDEASLHLGNFYAWHANLPGMARPDLPSGITDLGVVYDMDRVRFSLNSRGNVRSPDLVTTTAAPNTRTIAGLDGLSAIQFRPRFIGRRWRSVDELTIDYFYPRDEQSRSSASLSLAR